MVCSVQFSMCMCSMKCTCSDSGAFAGAGVVRNVHCALYHGLAIYREVIFVNVTSVADNTE